MTILAALAKAYGRLDAPPFGYSLEKIGILVGLNEDGSVSTVTPWMEGEGRKRKPRPLRVPQAVKRTAGISPNFLWDKTSYVLGVTAAEGKRTADEHRTFVERHVREIGDSDDPGLKALVLFLQRWTPDQFIAPLWPEDLKDQNVVFALESERLRGINLHDRPAARALWTRVAGAGAAASDICLVTGEAGPVARLHPAIKGVWGAQSSGAALVSFNLDAFTSYGHEQGDNAPVSEAAAFAYTTALNHFLDRDSGHRIQIGDASTVFWADAAEMVKDAEAIFAAFIDPAEEERVEETMARDRIGTILKHIRKGDQLADIEPKLTEGVNFYVLGLAPNAARLSVRFFYEGDFGELTKNYQLFVRDIRVEPPPREPYPPLWRYLIETAVLGKRENIAPNLAGNWMRAILTGADYPRTLLQSVLTRIRADGEVNALRAGILKAMLNRNFRMEAPVALERDEKNRGYVLGRLFALYEEIQRAALGGKVNATIKDKFYGSASATPRKVFAMLESGSSNHLAKIRKVNKGREVNLDKELRALMDLMTPSDDPASDPFPVSLSDKEQAYFGLGYHHQRSEFFKKPTETASDGDIQE